MADTQTPPFSSEAAPSGDIVREQDKIMLVLAYFGVLALIPLLTVKDSEYVRWHAKQGTALMAVWFGWAIVGLLINVIPIAGTCLYGLVHLGFLALAAMGIVKAFAPSRWKIPLVSSLAEKF
ncbi:MAG: hypothetical protein HY901_35315 [Deltaproteobacteria bacterium]|nr:hypothetical protein [Deltaproteobacteria bacterium]